MIHEIIFQNKQTKCTRNGIHIKPNIFKIRVSVRGSEALNSYGGEEEEPTPTNAQFYIKKGEKELAMFETSWKVVYAYNLSTQGPEAERSQPSYEPWLSHQKET